MIDSRILWTRYFADHSVENRNRLVETYLHKAMDYARRYFWTHSIPSLTFEDLQSFTCEKLIEIVERYDPSRGVAFSTYCWYGLHGGVVDGLRQWTWLSREAYKQVDSTRMVRLEEGDDDNLPHLMATEEKTPILDIREEIERELHCLPEIERVILEEVDGMGRTLLSVARSLSVSESRVCQLRSAALKRIWDNQERRRLLRKVS